MTIRAFHRVFLTAAATAAVLVACGGDIAIGSSQNPLVGDACAVSECGATPFTCSNGAATDVACTRHQGACTWSGKCPGDCPPAKCADEAVGCAGSSADGGPITPLFPTNLRCAPSAFRGVGSAPADQCEILFECAPKPVVTCAASACANQGFACLTGPATNLRCVPDPNAGVGSNPVGACLLLGDCPSGNDASAGPPDATADVSAGNGNDASVDAGR